MLDKQLLRSERSGVILSAAKDLPYWATRSFTAAQDDTLEARDDIGDAQDDTRRPTLLSFISGCLCGFAR
jgi:hypothetical protein